MEVGKQKFKVVILGANNVGKTSIVNSIQNLKFQSNNKPTDVVKAIDLKIELQQMNQEVIMHLLDLPGRESFMVLNRMYLRDANAAIIVYDVNNAKSFEDAEMWISELEQNAPSECVLALCGNQMDTEISKHQVSTQDALKIAQKYKINVYGEVSAKTKENLDNFFLRVANEIYNNRSKFVFRTSLILSD